MKLNQGEADLAAAAGPLEQAKPEDCIPDYYCRRRQTLDELKAARQAVAIKRYRRESRCQAESTPPAGEPEPAVAPANRQIRDCHA